MMRSLRSRLIVGMLLGMALLLVAADTTIYTVQRRQLYRAFDETLLTSANSLALLIHRGPFGIWFDSEGLTRLPAGRVREGALFQFWSDQPIDQRPPRPGPDSSEPERSTTRPFPDDRPSPEPWFAGPGGPDGPPPFGPPPEPPREWPAPTEAGTGVFVFRSSSLNGGDLPRLDALPRHPRFEEVSLPDGTSARAVGLQFQLSTPEPGPRRFPPTELTAVVAASTAGIDKQLSFLAALLGATAVGTMAVAGGLAWLVVSRGLKPLAAVARNIAAMDETGLKRRIADHGIPQEIEPVVSQLNGLLGRLDEAFERERTLTADVAHELRTPVAEIRAITEVTLSRLRDPEEYRQALSETLDAAKTLQGLIERLLVLARLENGQMQPELQLVLVKPQLAQQWMMVRSHAETRGVTYEDRCPPEVTVSADPRLLEVILSNAMANAVTYTPDGGRITVEARREGTSCTLSIANSGCELGPDEMNRVFDRFWRADAARNKSGLNCGLGLSLVKRAMEAIGGKAEARIGGVRDFVLTLTFDSAEPGA